MFEKMKFVEKSIGFDWDTLNFSMGQDGNVDWRLFGAFFFDFYGLDANWKLQLNKLLWKVMN